MKGKFRSIRSRFAIWRYKNLPIKNFIFILSVITGACTGITAVLLKKSTFWIKKFTTLDIFHNIAHIYIIFPIIGLLTVYTIAQLVFKSKPVSAIPLILKSLAKSNNTIDSIHFGLPLLLAPITVGLGGSVGLLGPAISIGATISCSISNFFYLKNKNRIMLIGCACAASIAAIFKSPMAGLIFAVEVFSLDLTLSSLLPLLLASVTSVTTSYLLLGEDILFDNHHLDKFKIQQIPMYILLGGCTGFASIYFSRMYEKLMMFFQGIQMRKKLLYGGIFMAVLLYLIPPLYGEGLDFIRELLLNQPLKAIGKHPFEAYEQHIWVVLLLIIGIVFFKAIATTTTIALGGFGGLFIPIIVMGSALGFVIAELLNQLPFGLENSQTNFTLLGMAGLISGVLHAPLTAVFLIAEISSSYELLVPLMITCAISLIISKNKSELTIFTKALYQQGILITHNKDQAVLTLLELETIIEKDFIKVYAQQTLKDLVYKAIAKSNRNFFPVVCQDGKLIGIVFLDKIRDVIFDCQKYQSLTVEMLMDSAPKFIDLPTDKAKDVMLKFQNTGAWNLPVIKDGKYYGFISKSKLLSVYRQKLVAFSSN